MALFKISRGGQANLPENLTDGYAYFTKDGENFYIDIKENEENGKRVHVNKKVIIENGYINSGMADNEAQKIVLVNNTIANSESYFIEIELNIDEIKNLSTENEIFNSTTYFNIISSIVKMNLAYKFEDTAITAIRNGNGYTDINIPLIIKYIPKEIEIQAEAVE